MMALKTQQVILEVNVDGSALNVAPRQVQRDPVRGDIEHVDLIVLSAKEVRERLVVGAAVAKAEKVADEEELDSVTVVMAVRELLDEGLEADEAIEKAVSGIREQQAEAAAAASVAAAAEDAAEADASEGEANASESAESASE
jgi:large subunit ribosomal protein L25